MVITLANSGDRKDAKALLVLWFVLGLDRLRKLRVDDGYDDQPLYAPTGNRNAMIRIAMSSILIRWLA